MRLDELPWKPFRNSNSPTIRRIVTIKTPEGETYKIWEFRDGTYDFDLQGFPGGYQERWNAIDEMTAQCVLLHLLGAPHASPCQPEAPEVGATGD
jgi:hypothetical protein